MNNVMIDIESLGTRPGSVILSIGAVRFNPAAGECDPLFDGEKFYRNIDVFDSLLAGLTVDEATCKWWSQQSKEAIGVHYKASVGLKAALNSLNGFIRRSDYVWAKGPDFDLVLLQAAYHKIGQGVPWSFRNARDVRTILHLGYIGQVGNLPRISTKHNALGDAEYQAAQVNKVYRHYDFDTTTNVLTPEPDQISKASPIPGEVLSPKRNATDTHKPRC